MNKSKIGRNQSIIQWIPLMGKKIRNQYRYLPPLVVGEESEFVLEPSVTLTPRREDEEQTDEVEEEEEEMDEGKSSAVKILRNWIPPEEVLWMLRGESRTPRQSPNPNSISDSSGEEESSEDKTILSSLEIVDIECWESMKLKEDWGGGFKERGWLGLIRKEVIGRRRRRKGKARVGFNGGGVGRKMEIEMVMGIEFYEGIGPYLSGLCASISIIVFFSTLLFFHFLSPWCLKCFFSFLDNFKFSYIYLRDDVMEESLPSHFLLTIIQY